MVERKKLIGNRKYKDRLFRMLFSDKEKLLELYNALNGSSHTNAEDLEITTLDDVLYMNMKNDVSILLDDYLSLYEHQSTLSDNLPLRGFLYFSELYRPMIDDKRIYNRKMIELPTPVYIVFYNGDASMGESETKRLSAAFKHGNEQSKMELEVTILNVNYGHNKELMEQCRTLKEYAIFIDKIKQYKKKMDLAQAIGKAIEECIGENVLRDFLMRRKKEVTNSILTQYDEEEVMKMISKESYEDGVEYGLKLGEERIKLLVQKLTERNQYEDLKRALTDSEYCNELYKKFEI